MLNRKSSLRLLQFMFRFSVSVKVCIPSTIRPIDIFELSKKFVTFQELSTDSSQHVRAALASVIMGMAPLLGKVRLSSAIYNYL